MRTTLNIDDDLLAAAKELASSERCAVGRVVSRLLRHSLTGLAASLHSAAPTRQTAVAGFRPVPALAGLAATNQRVDALPDDEGL